MLEKTTRRMLMGMGAVLCIAIVAWLAHAGFGYSTNSPAIPAERNKIEKPLDRNGPQAIDADVYFELRSRATEEGFFSAFPFHG